MDPEQKQLADYISGLSEQSYGAGWMEGVEYVLWTAMIEGPRRFGVLEVTIDHVAKLRQLSDACGGWVRFDNETGETFVPLAEWLCAYQSKGGRLPDWAT